MNSIFTTLQIFFITLLIFIAAPTLAQKEIQVNQNQELIVANNIDSLHTLKVFGEDKSIKDFSSTEITRSGGLVFLSYHNESIQNRLFHISKNNNQTIRIKHIPLWLSIVPPLIAIILALIFKEVIVSLFIGIWMGSFIAGGMRFGSVYYVLKSLFDVVKEYIIEAMHDKGHLSVILFSLLIGGMVSIISKNGGMAGVVQSLSRFAKTPRSSQFITWFLGVAIFFDDYANTLIVGNTMRSVTDKFKVSREKLAYIVDSTAAPIAAVAFITTWIGAELGYIDDGIAKIGLDNGQTAYAIFIESLKYSFYPILTLTFILFIIYTRKDFGPMLVAERRAKLTGRVSPALNEADDEEDMEDLSPVEGAPLKWFNAFIPVATVIFMTLYGLLDTGFDSIMGDLNGKGISVTSWSSAWSNMHEISSASTGFFTKLGTIIGASDSYTALIWASLTGVIVALILTWSQRIMRLKDSMHWLIVGFKTMMPALIILVLAWALAITTEHLHTADYLSSNLADSINPFFFPVVIFVLAAFISFSTGSSWSTMAILYPIAIPTTYAIALSSGLGHDITMELLYNVIATVLAASVLGDHCSPISDTTILSSLASDCNHIDHVRTQLPYALTVGLVSCLCTYTSTAVGGGWLTSIFILIIGIGVLFGVVKMFGKTIEAN